MDEKHNRKNSIFNRLSPATCKHLKPLSVYSMMISCEQNANLHPIATFSNPFINFKIEVLNNCQKKKKFNDSGDDSGYETPAKRAFSSKDLPLDLRCFMDTPPARRESLSPFATTNPADRTQSVGSERRETVSSQLHEEHVECGSSIEPWSSKASVPHGLKSEEVLLNHAPDFDCDVDDILCLNPIRRPYENVESCKFPSRLAFEEKPVLNPSVVHGQNMDRGDWQVEGDKEEHIKNMVLNVKDVEEDKEEGHSSVSFIKDHEMGKNLSQLPLVASSPQIKVDTVKQPGDESQPGSSSEQGIKLVTSKREVDWEREKRLYVHSVTRHMNEKPHGDPGVVTELQNLMTHVADQTPGTDGRQWQHPSDLTRRNYKQRFGNVVSKMPLNQWQAKNCPTHKRFSKVPTIFERSQFPQIRSFGQAYRTDRSYLIKI